MRILHVVATRQRRGAEIFASHLVSSLGEVGVDQDVAVLRGSRGPKVEYGVPTMMLASDGSGLPLLRVNRKTLGALRSLIEDRRPDILHAHGGEALKYSVLAGAGRKCPLVYRRIGAAPSSLRRGLRRRAHGVLMRRADRIVTLAEPLREETISLFNVSPSRVVNIPTGRDIRLLKATQTREATRRALGIPSGARVLLSLGALAWEKDPRAHLQVGSAVLAEYPDAVHLVVGDGPLRREVETIVRDRHLDGRILMLGARDDIPDLLNASDVVLLPSRSEGMPGAAIEAGMAGCVVVGYALPGVAEVVEDGATGLLTPPGDVDGLTASTLRLLEDDQARRTMGQAARSRCRERFDITAIAGSYLELYKDTVRHRQATKDTESSARATLGEK